MNIKANRPTTAAAHSTPTKNAAYARTIHEAATLSLRELLNNTSSSISGLDAQQVINNRAHFGTNKVTREKKQSLGKRLAGAFINPFTAILFCLALVSAVTDMIFPALSLFDSTPADFDCLTVVIILTMVFISGTLRFIQESRSGNAAEKLLSLITTTCTVTRKEEKKSNCRWMNWLSETSSICPPAICCQQMYVSWKQRISLSVRQV